MQSGKKEKKKKKKETKGIQFIKEEIKGFVLKNDMIVFLENPKESTKKALRINEFCKVTRHLVNMQKLTYVLAMNN